MAYYTGRPGNERWGRSYGGAHCIPCGAAIPAGDVVLRTGPRGIHYGTASVTRYLCRVHATEAGSPEPDDTRV